MAHLLQDASYIMLQASDIAIKFKGRKQARDTSVAISSRLAHLAASTAAIALSLSLLSEPARACSGIPPFSGGSRVLPADGSQDVPLNTRVLIHYDSSIGKFYKFQLSDAGIGDAGSFDIRDVVVRQKGGELVVGSLEHVEDLGSDQTLIFKPQQPLKPGTEYEVLDRVPDGGCFYASCIGPLTVRATFTTGNTEDKTPPVFAGLTGIEFGASAPGSVEAILNWPEVCDSSGCCGPYAVIRFRPQSLPAVDDRGPVIYEVYEGFRRIRAFSSSVNLTGEVSCDGHVSRMAMFATTLGAEVSVRAVDLAGNRDANQATVRVTGKCPAPSPQSLPPDAAAPDAASGGRDETGDGCSFGSTDPHGGSGLLWLMIVVVVFRRSSRLSDDR